MKFDEWLEAEKRWTQGVKETLDVLRARMAADPSSALLVEAEAKALLAELKVRLDRLPEITEWAKVWRKTGEAQA